MNKLTYFHLFGGLRRAIGLRRNGCSGKSAPVREHRALGHAEPLRCPGAYALLAGVARR